MPTPMEIDGAGDGVDHSKPVTPAKRDYGSTNIESLTNKINQITISQLAKEQQQKKKVKYIDTSKLLNFKRETK
ncbi:TPA: hypothetical protein N0F65_009872 [Lagenidium giganteum]|uniref:Uncharacterized protein n=1 Tax=Lagenidium giganteum TaxID=4803 RepID=A0AAV2YUP9_9STRA|nr:TPA: hypothetical protein N0F65_009872 [Lagenidium giganteum]